MFEGAAVYDSLEGTIALEVVSLKKRH